jgi:spore coat polysaccharide biosynthesis protein SpsF (cytidylyltransferase family)
MIGGTDAVVLAVPDEADSDDLEQIAQNLNVRVVRGPEDDVLSRYLIAARAVDANHVMRITADCPLIDPEVCGQVLETAKQLGVDYASNVMPRTFERGLDCEAFTRWTLELAARNATEPYDREHVTPFMQRAPHLHRVNVESGNPERALQNWCVDTEEDLERVRAVLEQREAA